MDNQKDIAKKIRREAVKKNWRLFKRSKLGMIGLYIVIFFLFLYSKEIFLSSKDFSKFILNIFISMSTDKRDEYVKFLYLASEGYIT